MAMFDPSAVMRRTQARVKVFPYEKGKPQPELFPELSVALDELQHPLQNETDENRVLEAVTEYYFYVYHLSTYLEVCPNAEHKAELTSRVTEEMEHLRGRLEEAKQEKGTLKLSSSNVHRLEHIIASTRSCITCAEAPIYGRIFLCK